MKKIIIITAVLVSILGFAAVASAQSSSITCNNNGNNAVLCNPTGISSPIVFIGDIFEAVALFLGAATIVMIVYSGFRMITSGGNEESVSRAKNSLKWSLIGLAVTVSSFGIVSIVSNFFGVLTGSDSINPNDPSGVQGNYNPLASVDYNGLFDTIFKGTAGIIALVSFVFIIIGGFRYIMSRGNEEEATAAKRTLTWAIGGLLIVILAYVIVSLVLNLLGQPLNGNNGRVTNVSS